MKYPCFDEGRRRLKIITTWKEKRIHILFLFIMILLLQRLKNDVKFPNLKMCGIQRDKYESWSIASCKQGASSGVAGGIRIISVEIVNQEIAADPRLVLVLEIEY